MRRSRAELQHRIWEHLGQFDYPYKKLKRIEAILDEGTIALKDILHPKPLVKERARVGKLECVIGRPRKRLYYTKVGGKLGWVGERKEVKEKRVKRRN